MLYNVHVSFNTFWKFLRPGNSAWDFWGLIFDPGIFFLMQEFRGFDFCPHLIIPVTWGTSPYSLWDADVAYGTVSTS